MSLYFQYLFLVAVLNLFFKRDYFLTINTSNCIYDCCFIIHERLRSSLKYLTMGQ